MGPRSLGFVVALLTMLGGVASALEGEEQCPTWLPDFHCDRQGRYEGFVMPMQMPYLFEEPFITSGLQAVAIWHDYPGESAFAGGEMWVLALQLRVAITDRLAFIATKDGVAFHRPNNPVLTNKTGVFDIAAGFKYALIDMPEKNFIVSPSFRIDVPVGQRKVFSGNGKGVAIPGLSWAWGVDRLHLVGDLGGRIPFDGDKETTQFFWNLHLDYGVLPWLAPFFEIGGLHYTNSGDGNFQIDTSLGILPLTAVQGAFPTAGRFDGVDVANIGSIGVAGNDIVIASFGARVPLNQHLSLGASYDFPVTSREDIFHQRATLSLVYDF